ncbi:hypothetical protein SAMN02787118_10530 [Streptomyces mirabilis]|jgi:hypothetical protein|uniref:Uncharacterized protein n=1 Tax=Streptomyces mirabilis TaxID=68239 RepID=A0A1I2HB60_9ACTN|nr:hypothetical protein SAMN02787118_10530 [Streptomyces mirabilis]
MFRTRNSPFPALPSCLNAVHTQAATVAEASVRLAERALAWHPDPAVGLVAHVLGDLARDEGVRLYFRITLRVAWTRTAALLDRGRQG